VFEFNVEVVEARLVVRDRKRGASAVFICSTGRHMITPTKAALRTMGAESDYEIVCILHDDVFHTKDRFS
jgi:hypothetical protein